MLQFHLQVINVHFYAALFTLSHVHIYYIDNKNVLARRPVKQLCEVQHTVQPSSEMLKE